MQLDPIRTRRDRRSTRRASPARRSGNSSSAITSSSTSMSWRARARPRSDPRRQPGEPQHRVELMDRLVHQHATTGVAPLLAPAAPLRNSPAGGTSWSRRASTRKIGPTVARLDHRAHLRVRRLEPVLEADLHDEAGGARRLAERVAVGRVGDERLLAVHVQAGRERVAHQRYVGARRRRQDHRVDETARVQLGRHRRTREPEAGRRLLAHLVDHVADRRELVLGHASTPRSSAPHPCRRRRRRQPEPASTMPQVTGRRAG